ncbi:hypothetical protein R6Q59_018320 [Mikania micrantha]
MSVFKESQHLKISLEEIETATKNFQECIGKGGYGMVYKGQILIDGKLTTVAVKRLNEQFGQGLKEFLIEIQLLTGQNHPNLISLLGYCDEGKEKIIVYEYAEHGSLDRYLRRNKRTCVLNWLERLKICVDAARGLNHLHNHVGKHQTIIHRDVKSSNILLDHNWVAKISDLGLSKLSLSGLNRSSVVSHACGTHGYCEPEYFSTGVVKKESDVYSFGMVLFEVVCGRMCVVMDDDGFMLSAPLVKDYYQKKKLDEIVDPALSHQISFESMNKFSSIAYQCLHDDRKQRPPMHLVKKELEELLKMELPSYALETPSRISSLNEASYGSDVERQGFDETLQAQAGNVVGNLDAGVKDTSISFDLEKEISTKINQDEVKVVLNSNKGIWKSQKLVHLVEDYLETNLETLDLCDSVMTSLKRVRETRLLIFEALHHFDDEDLAKENSYEKTLYNLKNLKAVGDIFTKDFFWIFNFVHRKQIAFLERLQLKKAKLYKVLDQTWVYSLLKNHKNGTKMRKEVISFMQRGSLIAMSDLDKIKILVERLEISIESLMMNADFAIRTEDAVRIVMDDIQRKLESFSGHVNQLGETANLCIVNIQKARSVLFQRIIVTDQ